MDIVAIPGIGEILQDLDGHLLNDVRHDQNLRFVFSYDCRPMMPNDSVQRPVRVGEARSHGFAATDG